MLIAKILIWLTAEILLNFIEIDNLVDYGEFIFHQGQITQTPVTYQTITNYP